MGNSAQFDRVQVVELLLGVNKTDVNYRNHRGRTPLSIAAGNGHYEVLKRLLDPASTARSFRLQRMDSSFLGN
jgi:ankyrin repeat protein